MRDIQVRSMEKVCVFICSVFFFFQICWTNFWYIFSLVVFISLQSDMIYWIYWKFQILHIIWDVHKFLCYSYPMEIFFVFFYVSYSTPMRFLSRVCKFNQDFYFFSLSLSFNIFHKRINWNTINTIKKRKWTGRK